MMSIILTPKSCSLGKIIFLLELLASCLLVDGERPEDELLKIITEDRGSRDMERLQQKLSGRNDFSKRKSLPKGDLFKAGLEVEEIYCGSTFAVNKEGYIFFNLKPLKQPCTYTFLGARKIPCTVVMLCRGKIELAPKESNGNCEKEYLMLSDGTEGEMTGCGSFTFGGKPRMPRNNGTDLYVTIRGSSPKRCIVFCLEELGEKRPGINEVKRIKANPKWKGFEMESGCKCGKRNDVGRVVGGETAFKFEFPWIGSIVFNHPKHRRRPFCGGSLVNSKYLVSAAHCFVTHQLKPEEIQIILHHHVMDRRVPSGFSPDHEDLKKIPGWDLPEETDESEESLRLEAEQIIIHPLFDENTFAYDVAIVKFKTPVELKDKKKKVIPICLPEIREGFKFDDGQNMVVAGWGYPWETAKAGARVPQKLDVPFLNNKDCRKYTVPTPQHVCAGYLEGGKDACGGDSGGPLIYKFDKEQNIYLLSGVVSAGAGCARKNKLGLYSDVQEMIQWIRIQVKDGKFCPRN